MLVHSQVPMASLIRGTGTQHLAAAALASQQQVAAAVQGGSTAAPGQTLTAQTGQPTAVGQVTAQPLVHAFTSHVPRGMLFRNLSLFTNPNNVHILVVGWI